MEKKAPSAAEAEWREIYVHIYPHADSATFIVRLRKRKGMDVLFDRRLGRFDVLECSADQAQTLAGVLQLVAWAATTAARDAAH